MMSALTDGAQACGLVSALTRRILSYKEGRFVYALTFLAGSE
jgi:hypothetical protein